MFANSQPHLTPAQLLERRLDRFLACWARIDARNIEPFAGRAARFLGVPQPPRCAAVALSALGAGVRRESLPAGVWAVWTIERDRYVVRISPFLSASRGNFALWHECFEIMTTRPAFPHPPPRRALERLADRFAACITMPEAELRLAAAGVGVAGDKSNVLAAHFGVSVSAMRRRMRELGLSLPQR